MNDNLMTAPVAPDLPAPIDLLADATKAEPYPLDAFPTVLRDAIECIADYVQAPIGLAGQSVLGAITHIAQSRVNAPAIDKPSERGQPCGLFLLTLGLSGDRKTACRDLAFKVQDEREQRARTDHAIKCECLEAGAIGLKGKKLEEYWKENPLPKDPSTTYSDLTIERLAGDFIRGKSFASIDTDEGGQLLGGASLKAETRANAIGGLCRAFDSGRIERTRSHGNAEGSGFAFNRRLNIHLMAQPVTVKDALEDPLLRDQGFLPRFMLCAPKSLAGTRLHTLESLNRSAYSDARMQRYWARYAELANTRPSINPETNEVTAAPLEVEPDAWGVWLEHYNRGEAEQAPLGQYSGMGSFAARGGQLAQRVATVLAFFEGTQRINAVCMLGACKLVQHSLNEWHRQTHATSIPKEVQQAADLMEWLKDPKRADKWAGWFTFNSLGKSGPKALRNARKLRAVITVLLKNNHLLTRSDGKEYKIYTVERAERAERAEPAEIPTARSAEEVRIDAEEVRNQPSDSQFSHDSGCESAESANLPHTSANLPHSQPIDYKVNPQNPHFPHDSGCESANQDYEEF